MAAVPEELEHDLESAYRAHFPLLYRRARRWLPPDEAEDLVQETFLRAWANHAGTNPGVPWLLTVLRNLAIDRSRKKAPVLVDDVSTLETPSLEDASDNVIRFEEQRRVRTAISALTDAQQQVIRLREWGGMTQQEIADNLGTTVPSVESLLQRGRRQLRKSLDHAMGLILIPATGFWRKLRGLEGFASSTPSVGGLTMTVANLATAATIIVAGAAAPLGARGEAPETRPAAPRVVIDDTSAPASPALVTEQAESSGAGGNGSSGTLPSTPSSQQPAAGGEQSASGGASSSPPASGDGSTGTTDGSLGASSDDPVGTPNPTGGKGEQPPISGDGDEEPPATGPGNPPPSSDDPPAQTPNIADTGVPGMSSPTLDSGPASG